MISHMVAKRVLINATRLRSRHYVRLVLVRPNSTTLYVRRLTFGPAPLHSTRGGPQFRGGDGDDTKGFLGANVLLVAIGKVPFSYGGCDDRGWHVRVSLRVRVLRLVVECECKIKCARARNPLPLPLIP